MDKILEFLNSVLPKLFEKLIDSFSVSRAAAYTILGVVVVGGLVITQELLSATLPDGELLIKAGEGVLLIWVQRILILVAFVFRYKPPVEVLPDAEPTLPVPKSQ